MEKLKLQEENEGKEKNLVEKKLDKILRILQPPTGNSPDFLNDGNFVILAILVQTNQALNFRQAVLQGNGNESGGRAIHNLDVNFGMTDSATVKLGRDNRGKKRCRFRDGEFHNDIHEIKLADCFRNARKK